MAAWEDFLSGVTEAPRARPLILRSWQRSLAGGVDPRARGATLLNAREETLRRLRLHNRDLLTAAAPALAEAVDLFTGTGSIVLLTDARGVVLEGVGDRRTLEAGREIHLEPGGDWSEAQAGTNGIGTALASHQPMLVHAAEHFCEGVKSWTCAGAPIRDPADGKILGLLDISGPKATFQRHNLALAVVAARQVERALAERARTEREWLLEACLERLPTWLQDGIVALDRRGRVVHASERAQRLLDGWGIPSTLLGDGRIEAFDLGAAEASGRGDLGWAAAHLPPGLSPDWLKPLALAGGERVGTLVVIPAREKAPRGGRAAARGAPAGPGTEAEIGRCGFERIVGRSPAILAAIERSRRLSAHCVPVLIEGETGAGKELFARAIHRGAPDGSGPFVAVNCGALPRELLASELFGYVRGAFTGASSEGRVGRFEEADGGTLCLDEIGELPLDLQPYLLRVLEEGVVCRVGDSRPRPVNLRLISMTNRDLRTEVEAGRFRRDLYHRISVTSLRIPPLRERGDDVELLAMHFAALLAGRHGLPARRFSPAALRAMRSYAWPGNVRELRNAIESALLIGEGEVIQAEDLPGDLPGAATPAPVLPQSTLAPGTLQDLEREAILAALSQHKGNLVCTARALRISRSTLYRKLARYGICLQRPEEWDSGPFASLGR